MIRLALGFVIAATTAHAGGLMDRNVTFGALAYDDPDQPVFVGQRHAALVGPHIEYGLGPEGAQNGWDIVPAIIDIRDHRIIITYPQEVAGAFPQPVFNGYVLDFLTDCVLFNGAEQDLENSTVTLEDDAVFSEGSKLYLNMGGQPFGPQTFITISVDVADCPLS